MAVFISALYQALLTTGLSYALGSYRRKQNRVLRCNVTVTEYRLLGFGEPWDVYISWVLVSTGVWLTGILAIRYTLKALLSYHAWMYEPRHSISLLTKLWLVVRLHCLS